MHVEAVDRFLEVVQPSAELAPMVAAVRGLAARLDLDDADAGLWREYRFMLRDLMGQVGSHAGDALESEFAALDG